MNDIVYAFCVVRPWVAEDIFCLCVRSVVNPLRADHMSALYSTATLTSHSNNLKLSAIRRVFATSNRVHFRTNTYSIKATGRSQFVLARSSAPGLY